MPAAGGEPQDLTQLAEGEVSHRYPEFLPGGDAVLFAAFEGIGIASRAAAIHALSLSTGERKLILRGATQPRYAVSGHLMYAVGTTLYAVAFDPGGLEVTGDPVPVIEGVSPSTGGGSLYAVSAGGALVYVSGVAAQAQHALVWVDREGREEPIGAPPRYYHYPRLSPDGTRIALLVAEGEQDIWIWDLGRETLTRLTFSPRIDTSPVWSPDGRTVFFASQQEGADWDLAGRLADGTGEPMRLTRQRSALLPTSVTPDGAGLVVNSGAVGFSAEDILWVDTAGKAEPRTLLDAESSFLNAEVSPDGRWLAYESNESGTSEIFVRPFPALDSGRWPVSTGGGTQPLWSRDGREIFYLDASGLPDGGCGRASRGRVEHRPARGRDREGLRQPVRGSELRCLARRAALPDDQGSHAGAGRCRWPDRPGAELVRRAAAPGAGSRPLRPTLSRIGARSSSPIDCG